MKPILIPDGAHETRILRPDEYEAVVHYIPKPIFKAMFQTLFFTGLRYTELKYVFSRPELFSGTTIEVPSFKAKSKKIRAKRWVRLNHLGVMATINFLNNGKAPPSHEGWRDNLKRWTERYAHISGEGMGCKCTRKTWESYLIISGFEPFRVCSSMGHTEITSLKHYVNLPFSDEEIKQIKELTVGWK